MPNCAASPDPAFPVEKQIRDITGRKIDAWVLSHDKTSVRIRRKSDAKEFDIALERLSKADREWLAGLSEAAGTDILREESAKTPGITPDSKKADFDGQNPMLPVLEPPKSVPKEEVLAQQENQGLVPPPKWRSALATTIRFKDGPTFEGYVYDVKGDEFYYAQRDMIQKVARMDQLSALSRIDVERWRTQTYAAVSPLVALNLDGGKIIASIIRADQDNMMLLTETGELMEQVGVPRLDPKGQKFLEEWKSGKWKPTLSEWVIPPNQFTMARPFFAKGKALVMKNKKWGLIDRSGEFVDPPRYDEIVEIPSSPNLKVRVGDKWGLLLDGGRLAVPPEWEDVGDLHQGMIPVRSSGKWGYVEDGGKKAISCSWDDAWRFSSSGTAVVTLNGKRGFVDRLGKVIVKPEWDGAIMHSPEGVGAVRRNNGWALVDSKGKLLCEPIWNFTWSQRCFELGYIPAWPMGLSDMEPNNGTLLGMDGKPNSTPKLRKGVCLAWSPGPVIGMNTPQVDSSTSMGATTQQGQIPIGFPFPKVSETVLRENLIDVNGVPIDKPGGDTLPPESNLIRIQRDGKWGLADRSGEVIVEPFADFINFFPTVAPSLEWAIDKRFIGPTART